MGEYVPDNLDLYSWHEARQRARERQQPRCAICGMHLEYDECYELDGDTVCCDCRRDHFNGEED